MRSPKGPTANTWATTGRSTWTRCFIAPRSPCAATRSITLLHGSAFVLDQTDSANITAMRTEAEAMKILKATVREPVAVYLRSVSGGSKKLRVSIKQRAIGEARVAIAALFGGIMRLKHVYVFDEDIDIHDDR